MSVQGAREIEPCHAGLRDRSGACLERAVFVELWVDAKCPVLLLGIGSGSSRWKTYCFSVREEVISRRGQINTLEAQLGVPTGDPTSALGNEQD